MTRSVNVLIPQYSKHQETQYKTALSDFELCLLDVEWLQDKQV